MNFYGHCFGEAKVIHLQIANGDAILFTKLQITPLLFSGLLVNYFDRLKYKWPQISLAV